VNDDRERNVISGNLFHGVGIGFAGTDDNVVAGNYIGTDATGTRALSNGHYGVFIGSPGIPGTLPRGNRVGVIRSAAERNIISANPGTANVNVNGDQTVLAGNYIGTDVTGTLALGGGRGVEISGGRLNRIGSDLNGQLDDIERNLISGNRLEALLILDNSEQNLIAGNFIGTDWTGIEPLGNGLAGVRMLQATANTVSLNVLAFNGTDGDLTNASGVVVEDGRGNTITANSIHHNAGLGIDLGNDGVSTSDPLDADAGANNLQNFPVIASAASGAGATAISGSLQSTPDTTFTIEFFASPAADPSGHGEGQRFLGRTTVHTGADGNAAFAASVGTSATGEFVSATATDPGGNTSEFSSTDQVVRGTIQTLIDVKPEAIDVSAQGVLPVFVYSTADFDATRADVSSILFAGARPIQSALADVDGDGDLDLVLHFRSQETTLRSIYRQLLIDDENADGVLDSTRQTTQVFLTGRTIEDQLFEGSDHVKLFLSGKALRDLLDDLAAGGLI
jgi:hypothetical protein